MTASILRQPALMFGKPSRPDVFIRCTDGMVLRVPQHALHGRRGAEPKTEPTLRKLVRELVAFKRAKQK
jgi:hypothetical protein